MESRDYDIFQAEVNLAKPLKHGNLVPPSRLSRPCRPTPSVCFLGQPARYKVKSLITIPTTILCTLTKP